MKLTKLPTERRKSSLQPRKWTLHQSSSLAKKAQSFSASASTRTRKSQARRKAMTTVVTGKRSRKSRKRIRSTRKTGRKRSPRRTSLTRKLRKELKEVKMQLLPNKMKAAAEIRTEKSDGSFLRETHGLADPSPTNSSRSSRNGKSFPLGKHASKSSTLSTSIRL